MIVKWKTSEGVRGVCQIERVEVTRETEHSVFTPLSSGNERRWEKRGPYGVYHDSWDKAFTYLLAEAERSVANVQRVLEIANSTLSHIKGMRKPADAE